MEREGSMTWIPVSERLPVEWQNVIVFDEMRGVRIGAWASEDESSPGCWVSPLYDLRAVTHWQPLPEPPGKD